MNRKRIDTQTIFCRAQRAHVTLVTRRQLRKIRQHFTQSERSSFSLSSESTSTFWILIKVFSTSKFARILSRQRFEMREEFSKRLKRLKSLIIDVIIINTIMINAVMIETREKKNLITINEFSKTRCLLCVFICRSKSQRLMIFCCKQFNSSTRFFESIMTYFVIKSTMTRDMKSAIINSEKKTKKCRRRRQ